MSRLPLHPDASGNRNPLGHAPGSSVRRFKAQAFKAFAFSATFFGLAMLVIFFWQLGAGVANWFRAMPDEVQKRNGELAAKASGIRAEIDSKLKEVDQFMQDELATAPTDAEKAQIRKDYEKIKARKKSDLETTAQEDLRSAERDVRPNTSPWALLWNFFFENPSNLPQDAGIAPALLGSILLALITVFCAVPLGVGAAIYLEEYKTTGWLPGLIQININNLAGVPSVVYGILGAFIFVDLIFKPLENNFPGIAARNALGGGLTLALLTLPIIIVAAQEAIRAVPQSIRHGAMALGATRWQVIQHHVLPNALPGILTGTILALARAIGEAAPLVFFGANLYVSQNPTLFSRFTVLPLQIFGWTDRPQDLWRYNAALASVILVVTLLALNAIAIILRNRSQRKVQW